jgi:hypothetical protein
MRMRYRLDKVEGCVLTRAVAVSGNADTVIANVSKVFEHALCQRSTAPHVSFF